MTCCENCFGDKFLRAEIGRLSKATGKCSYCHSDGQRLVSPSELRDQFEFIQGVYKEDPDGKTLVEWYKEDWGMFDHERMDVAHAKELLADILDDGDIVRQKFSPVTQDNKNAIDSWEGLRFELMHQNRYFPDKKIFDVDELTDFLDGLVADPVELAKFWFRARIQEAGKEFAAADMGAPPKEKATHGRANPAGIPYLYLASTAVTAVSEIRPHTGETAYVAQFTVSGDLRVVDLRQPRKTVSPFNPGAFREDPDECLEVLRSRIGLLERLGDELTRPVLPSAAAIHYIPSQYLCEFIKKCGFDGVMYRSSVGDGVNLALFNPTVATVSKVSKNIVSRVLVDIA